MSAFFHTFYQQHPVALILLSGLFLLLLAGWAVLAYGVLAAKPGYQDETGFHTGTPPSRL